LASNRGDNVDKVQLISLDVRNGHEEVVASDPEQEVDLDDTVFSPQTHRPAAGAQCSWTPQSDITCLERPGCYRSPDILASCVTAGLRDELCIARVASERRRFTNLALVWGLVCRRFKK